MKVFILKYKLAHIPLVKTSCSYVENGTYVQLSKRLFYLVKYPCLALPQSWVTKDKELH